MSFNFTPTGSVQVPEIPFEPSITLKAADTALVVVDMQNDFVEEGGSLVVEAAGQTLPSIAGLLQRARAAGVHIAFTQDTHLEGDREWQSWPEHCRKDSWGHGIVEELRPQEGELICQKSRYDGFYDSWLDHYLSRVWNVENVVIVGTVSSICVLHTAASAGLRWYRVIVPADGVSALTEFDQALTLRQVSFLYHGNVTRSVDDISFDA